MLNEILHIGITVSNMEHSVKFYRDILGLKITGTLTMEGPETDILFGMSNVKVSITYLKGTEDIISPPIELIQFLSPQTLPNTSKLNKLGISEICFKVNDIEKAYTRLKKHHINCISTPQFFDFSKYGFGQSKVLYFYDPDGTILELIEPL